MPSSGWEKLSDYDMAVWQTAHDKLPEAWGHHYVQKNGNLVSTPGELFNRGIIIKPCPVCEESRLTHNHDYICILCRRECST